MRNTVVDAAFPLSFVVQQVCCCHTWAGNRIEGNPAESNPAESNPVEGSEAVRSPVGHNPDSDTGQEANNWDIRIAGDFDFLADQVVRHSNAVLPVRVRCSHNLLAPPTQWCSAVR